MTARRKQSDQARRERRAFTREFKIEAVRLMHERRAAGVPLTQVGRELDVRPDQLREWARQFAREDGGLQAVGVVETPEQELQRLRRENAILREERAFAKKRFIAEFRECPVTGPPRHGMLWPSEVPHGQRAAARGVSDAAREMGGI